jgi:uroporphyrinogen III methyltransferase/synthase
MVFGRGGEEAQALAAAGVAFEIVPGVSSAIAGPAYAGIPVTHRAHNTQLTVLTGHEDPTKPGSTLDYAHLAATPGTKVLLMGVERIAAITAELVAAGADPDTPVAMVRQATTPGQETLVATLGTVAERVRAAAFKAPAVCVIGEVVGLRDQISWFENRPLFGKRIVVTRTRAQAGGLTAALRALGADAYEVPTIRTEPPSDLLGFAELVRDAHTYDWVLFTSPNGAQAFFDTFFKIYPDARSIGGAHLAAIGPGTEKVVRSFHLAVDLVPESSVAEAFAETLLHEVGSVENLRVLWVRPEEARDVIGKELAARGAIIDEAIAYRTVAESGDPTGGQARFRSEGADLVTFTSSSTVDHFMALGLAIPPATRTASIGPVTSASLRQHGITPDTEANPHTIPGLVNAITRLLGGLA